MKAGSDFEQTGHPAANLDASGARLCDPAKNLEERRLAGPVPADNANPLSLLDLEIDVPQSPKYFST